MLRAGGNRPPWTPSASARLNSMAAHYLVNAAQRVAVSLICSGANGDVRRCDRMRRTAGSSSCLEFEPHAQPDARGALKSALIDVAQHAAFGRGRRRLRLHDRGRRPRSRLVQPLVEDARRLVAVGRSTAAKRASSASGSSAERRKTRRCGCATAASSSGSSTRRSTRSSPREIMPGSTRRARAGCSMPPCTR